MSLQISRDQCVYTSHYCEENVYKLIELIKRNYSSTEIYAVFISNHSKKVPLFYQKCGRSPDGVAVWDYHVIVILRFNGDVKFHICDLDTTLDFPCDASAYWSLAIRPNSFYRGEYHRFFRIIDGEMYLRYFASDRSHMRTSDGWMAPPPSYDAISTSESTHNLPQYMDFPPPSDCSVSLLKQQLDSAPFGVVTTESVFCNFFGIGT
ncbi:unnamed protein product [Rodentolepis nana]|uniref:Protein N-terminal glutamine amidohydrolase n=1 Tax=Rodentolepis nana TaxID=102285 RepID=A0A0R3TBC1_RODNA|nr:unnamed protein product [Rodentolepis nana]